MKARCVKELTTKHLTFRVNEIYNAQKINERWYCVDAVGMKVYDFRKHFKLEMGGL